MPEKNTTQTAEVSLLDTAIENDPRVRWVSCSKREFGAAGNLAHLIVKGRLTTLCGYSASHSNIWRSNSNKTKCPTCEDAYEDYSG